MTRDDINAQAAFWVDRMNWPVFDPADGAAFDRWMGSSPAHREAFAAMSATWEDELSRLALVDAPNDQRHDTPTAIPDTRRRRVPMVMAMAAVVVLAVGISIIPRVLPRTYSSGTGGQTAIALADGSQIRLGGNSAVVVQYLPWRRSVELTRGEAAFDVAHDIVRPFAVDAGGAQVVVLGTAFHVDRLAGDAVAVQVSRGVVQVRAADRSDRLAAGQAARISGKTIRRVAMQEEDINWQSGWFVAHDVPLSDLVEKLRRHSNRSIHISDKEISGRLIVGRFKVSEPDAVLEAISSSYNLKVDYGNDRIIIMK